MTLYVLGILAIIVLLAGWRAHRRTRDTLDGSEPVVTDDILRQILEEGSVEGVRPDPDADAPLDEDEIREAEQRFWEEGEWDEPEEYSAGG